MTDTPALTVDYGPCNPIGCSIGALGDYIFTIPLNRLVVLLQALVEQAEVVNGGRIGCPVGFRWWCRNNKTRRMLLVRADGKETMLLLARCDMASQT